MRPALLLLLVLAFAGSAAAQQAKPEPALAVAPTVLAMAGGDHEVVDLRIHNPTDRVVSVRLSAETKNGSWVIAQLGRTELKLGPGATEHVRVNVTLAPDAPVGEHGVVFSLREARATAATSAAPLAGTAALRVRAFLAPAPAPAVAPVSWQAWALAGSAATVGAAGIALGRAHRKWGMLGLAPLYTRLAKHKLLDSPVRERFVALVRAEPGITFGEMQRKLDVGAGTLTHHARMLEHAGIVFSSPDGQTRRFFKADHGRVAPVASLAERAIAALHEGPATLSALAARLGVSRQALHYHVKRLVAEGRVRSADDGRELVLSIAA